MGGTAATARRCREVVARPGAVAIAAGGRCALAGIAVIPALDGPVIPSFKDREPPRPPGRAARHVQRGDGRIVARASRELRSVPGVSDVAGHLGRAVTGDQVVDVNSSEIWVKVDADADYDATKASIENVVDGLSRASATRR